MITMETMTSTRNSLKMVQDAMAEVKKLAQWASNVLQEHLANQQKEGNNAPNSKDESENTPENKW